MTKLAVILLVSCGVVQASPRAEFDLALENLEFTATTSLKALSVHGQAKELSGRGSFEGATLVAVEATVPIEALQTGMALRDRHMRERIFQTSDGRLPAIRFKSSSVECKGAQCSVRGGLILRDVMKESLFQCEVNEAQGSCTSEIKLSDFGIDRPSQLGVKVEDSVSIKLTLKRK